MLQYLLQHKWQITASTFANLHNKNIHKTWKLLQLSATAVLCNCLTLTSKSCIAKTDCMRRKQIQTLCLHSRCWTHGVVTHGRLSWCWGSLLQVTSACLVEVANMLNMVKLEMKNVRLCVCVRFLTVASRIDFNLGGFQLWFLLSTRSPKWQYRQLHHATSPVTLRKHFLPSDMRMLCCKLSETWLWSENYAHTSAVRHPGAGALDNMQKQVDLGLRYCRFASKDAISQKNEIKSSESSSTSTNRKIIRWTPAQLVMKLVNLLTPSYTFTKAHTWPRFGCRPDFEKWLSVHQVAREDVRMSSRHLVLSLLHSLYGSLLWGSTNCWKMQAAWLTCRKCIIFCASNLSNRQYHKSSPNMVAAPSGIGVEVLLKSCTVTGPKDQKSSMNIRQQSSDSCFSQWNFPGAIAVGRESLLFAHISCTHLVGQELSMFSSFRVRNRDKSRLYFGWFASAAFAGNLDKRE